MREQSVKAFVEKKFGEIQSGHPALKPVLVALAKRLQPDNVHYDVAGVYHILDTLKVELAQRLFDNQIIDWTCARIAINDLRKILERRYITQKTSVLIVHAIDNMIDTLQQRVIIKPRETAQIAEQLRKFIASDFQVDLIPDLPDLALPLCQQFAAQAVTDLYTRIQDYENRTMYIEAQDESAIDTMTQALRQHFDQLKPQNNLTMAECIDIYHRAKHAKKIVR